MGSRRFGGDGKRSETPSWRALRHSAKRILNGVSAGRGGGADCAAESWLESNVLGRRPSRPTRLVHTIQCERVRSMEATSSSDDGCGSKDRHFVLENIQLPRTVDDADGISLPRYAGSLS